MGSPGAVGAGPTGNAAAIRAFDAVAAHADALPAIRIRQSGYMTMRAAPAPGTEFRFGYGGVPKGYVRADETLTYVQHDGKVVWLTDVVVPASGARCSKGQTCTSVAPVELFVTTKAAFAGVIDHPRGVVGCFEHESFADVPYRAGTPWWTARGDFHHLATRGSVGLFTITYAWPDGQHATERDVANLAKETFVGSGVRVANGAAPDEVALSISERDAVLVVAPHAPKVVRC